MLTIDGSRGEGGGQIVRSSLALSLVTGKSVTIENIRAGRRKPGLMRQHLAAVRAAAEIGGGGVDGAEIGSKFLTFHPATIAAGEYQFSVGTAGSATLVLQTVLPALMTADGPSRVTLEGGTHNPWAPPFDFLDKAYLPLVCRMGPRISTELERPGFYPAGGGRFHVMIQPAPLLHGFDITQRGEMSEPLVRAVVAALPRHIAQRECDRIANKSNWPRASFQIDEVKAAHGPGNVVMIELRSQHVTEVFTGFGRQGIRAEKIADDVLKAAQAYLSSAAPIGPNLADQLMLPMGISAHTGGGGGTFQTMHLTRHSLTHMEIIQRFLDVDVQIDTLGPDQCRVSIARSLR